MGQHFRRGRGGREQLRTLWIRGGGALEGNYTAGLQVQNVSISCRLGDSEGDPEPWSSWDRRTVMGRRARCYKPGLSRKPHVMYWLSS